MLTRRPRPSLLTPALALLLASTVPARAQDTPDMPVKIDRPATPPADAPPADAAPAATEPKPLAGTILGTLSPVARAALDAPFNTPAEARALRLKLGVPSLDDLQDPRTRAAAAIIRGLPADASLSDPAADPLDRAEAALMRGDFQSALTTLADASTPRAQRIRIDALELAGRIDDARTAAAALGKQLAERTLTTSSDIVEGVRATATYIRLTGPLAEGGIDFQALIARLAEARALDPLDAAVPLAEGELLLEKDNFAQAREALNNCLNLQPTNARAWFLGGTMAVASFDFDTAEKMATRLDAIAGFEAPDVQPPEDLAPRSSLAAIVRARALLRQDSPAAARELLETHLAAAPSDPLLLETIAQVTAADYDIPALDRVLDAFETKFPRNIAAALRAGQTLADLRQYAQAARVLERAAALSPHDAAPVTELGLLEVQSGRDDRALAALQKATTLDPFNVRAANSLKLLTTLATATRVESDHFVVRARPGLDARLAREMLPILEEIHAAVTGTANGGLRYQPPFKTLIDLTENHASFAVRITGMSRIHTIAASTGPVIAMEAPRSGAGHTGPYDWARVVRHEYVHTVGLTKTGNRLPHWFTEAQAVYLERAPRDWNTVQLLAQTVDNEELFDFTEINIAFTRPKRPQDRALAYAQGHWMYQFMVEKFGDDAPLKLMDLYAQGIREEEAFTRVLQIGRDEFLSQFKPWARAQLTSWGMLSETIDAQEKSIRVALEASANKVTPELVPQLEAYALARPVDPLPHRMLARYYLGTDDAKALPHLRWLDERSDKESTYAAQIAAILTRQGDLAAATISAERAVRMSPYDASNREIAAAIAVQRRDFATARRHVEFLAELEPSREQHKLRLQAIDRLMSAAAPKPL